MIRILFFASLRERLKCESIEVDYESGLTLFDLKDTLMQKDEIWHSALSGNLLSAVEQEMVVENTKLTDGMEVAFFPPVTGG
ncbi:MoaD/ThiS family protein [Pleionea sediminis]|uniref:MoaD/ThiS family protein n=1 Tax=Pleionea sediminis TaxID=2569479 RepID=UPI001186E9AC|nr:MoaD/ThiS family protein [Pleionea sediminis]